MVLGLEPSQRFSVAPRVSYLGHGQLESSTENLSSLQVISHELGHVQEFRREAREDGADIRSLDVKIHYELRGGKLVAVGGETSVLTAKRNEEITTSNLEPYSDGQSLKDFLKQTPEKKGFDPREINTIEKKEELESKIKNLEDLLHADTEFSYDSLGKSNTNANPLERKSSKSEFYKEEMVREKKRLEEEVRLLKMQEETRKTFAMLTELQKTMVANVFGMMQIGSEDLKPGTLLETFI